MADVRERWLSGRSAALHVALLVVVPGCAIAAWWQINRAQDGNQLSYLYSVMWPVFGLLAIIFWWMLIHTDYETVGLKGMRRQQTAHTVASHVPNGMATSPAPTSAAPEVSAGSATDDDPDLAAYNARLADLAAKGPKTWRHREEVVVRRPQ
jgi:DNA-binding transcriptional regulator of glucitol operon